ncbi:MAG: hypothetical protein RLZ98_2838 [Pseudomonadota bacterium]|jgi:hypothetical protein
MLRLITRLSLGALVGMAIGFSAPIASAATVANKDKQEHQLSIQERKGEHKASLKPGGKLENICPNGCVLRVGDNPNAVFQLEGDEVVSIENGLLYYDGQELRAVRKKPAPGAVAR